MIIKTIILLNFSLVTAALGENEDNRDNNLSYSFENHNSMNIFQTSINKSLNNNKLQDSENESIGCFNFFMNLRQNISTSFSSGLHHMKNSLEYISSGLYQILVSNRWFGPQSGSCQTFNSILKSPVYNDEKNKIKVVIGEKYKEEILLLNLNKQENKLIGLDAGHCGWNSVADAFKTANEIQKITNAKTVCLPLNVQLTNIATQQIIHRVLFAAHYDVPHKISISVLDPQTALSANYLSNTQSIFEKQFKQLPNCVEKDFIATGLQFPFTGNCQKLSLYMAVQTCESKIFNISEGNSFCTILHNLNHSQKNKQTSLLSKCKSALYSTFSSFRRLI